MDSFCPIDDVSEPDFRKDRFENTEAISFMHKTPPRFGYHSDLNLLIDGDSEDANDYIKGLLASSFAMFCFFLVWITILLVLKCCGPKRVGFWSGRIAPLPAEPQPPRCGDELEASSMDTQRTETKTFQNYKEDHKEWRNTKNASKRRLNILRIIVLFCGTSIIVSATLMVSKGITSLVDTVDGGRDAIKKVANLTRQAIELVDSFLETTTIAQYETTNLLQATNGFCPNVRESLCEDISNATNCNFQGIPYASEIEKVVDYFDGVKGLVFEDVVKFRADLVTMAEAADGVDEKAKTFNWAFWVAASFALALALLCFIMMLGVILAWVHKLPRVFHCFRIIVIVPLFMFLVLISWVFSMVFVIGSMTLADTCIDSPDEIILDLLNNIRNDISSIIAEFLIFYISGCPFNAPPVDLDEQLRFAKDAVPAFVDFIDTLRGAAGQIEEMCGTPPVLMVTAADAVANILCKANLILRAVRLYFTCDNWYPLYEGLVYDTLCYSGTEGFAWVASTQFVIVFMTMVILTLRIAFYEMEVVKVVDAEEKSDDDDKEYSKSLAVSPRASEEPPIEDNSPSEKPEQPHLEMVDSVDGESEKGQEQPI